MECQFYHFNSLSSTQDKAKELSGKCLNNIVVTSDKQTKARGRFKRKWHSDKGGLWMSILLRPENTGNMQYLTFAAAVSVVKAIKKITNIKTSIKWPNDIHYKGKKLCGILTEGFFGKNRHIIVGIGLNVNQISFPSSIKNGAVSLKMIKNRNFDIKKLSKVIIREFFILYNKCYNKNKFLDITKLWKKYCDTLNKDIIITAKTKKLSGKAVGIDENCSLLLKLNNNRIIKIIEGDIAYHIYSVRKDFF